MADDTPWPLIEAALIDHLPTVTSIPWEAPGRSDAGARIPLGVVEQAGGGQTSGLDQHVDIETAGVIQRFKCHARCHCAITNHSHGFAR